MKTKDKYILRGRDVIPCDDLLEWGKWLEENRGARSIKHEVIGGEWEISTIFLALDHNIIRTVTGKGKPHLFETIVFRLRLGERIETKTGERCSTYDEAEAQHARIAAEFRKAVSS